MSKLLTLQEIKERFASEWVLLEDPETTEALEIKRGKVVWHSKDREEIHRKIKELRPKHPAIVYTGRLPEGTAVVL